jgi:hypothetical protein
MNEKMRSMISYMIYDLLYGYLYPGTVPGMIHDTEQEYFYIIKIYFI